VTKTATLVFLLAACAAAPLASQCPDGTPAPCAGPARAPAGNSIAVLYFDNLSRDTADAFLAQGLTEELIARLGQVPRLTVKSRYAVRRYRDETDVDPAAIGRTLSVAYLVTGSVQRSGDRLRVRCELARASTGNQVWGQQYERGGGDILAITEDIARSVATGVAGQLLPGERSALAARPTENREAYEHLVHGDVLLAQRTPASVRRAIAEYETATRLDPRLVSAWAKIGLAYAIWLDWGWSADGLAPPDSFLTTGVAAAARALALDSLSSDAWLAWGYLQTFVHPRDFAGAEAGMRRAVALNPRNAEAWSQLGDLLGYLQRNSEMAEPFRRALAIEPGRPITLVNLAAIEEPPQVLALTDSALAIDPDFSIAHLWRARARLLTRDTAGARADVAAFLRLAPAGTEWIARANYLDFVRALGDSAGAAALARRMLAELPATGRIAIRVGSILAPALAVSAGDTTAALQIVERMQPGAALWAFLWKNVRPDAPGIPARVPALMEESRPPWVRPPPPR
jgi:TolB-like protein/tetratricopeptide (TPR) repeat protein